MTDGSDSASGFGHRVDVWTVGRLRLALAGVPDQLPIRVLVADEPGGDVTVQVIYHAEVVDQAALDVGPRPGGPSPRLWLELCCDFPSGRYRRW